MTVYVALTTENAQSLGWRVVATAPTREEARALAHAEIERAYPNRLDIHGETRRRNIRICAKSRLVREGFLSLFQAEEAGLA